MGEIFPLRHEAFILSCVHVCSCVFMCVPVCEMNVHKQCSEDAEKCVGKQKKGDRDKDKKRASAMIMGARKQSNPNKDAGR